MINPDSGVQMTLVGNEGWHETKVDCHAHSANIKTYKAKIGNWDKKNGCASKLRDLKPISWLLSEMPHFCRNIARPEQSGFDKNAHLICPKTAPSPRVMRPSTRIRTPVTTLHDSVLLDAWQHRAFAHHSALPRSWLFRSIFQWMGNWWLLPVLYCSRIFIHLRHLRNWKSLSSALPQNVEHPTPMTINRDQES